MQQNTYKYLSIVFAIIAIVFAILYFTKPSAPVTETIGTITSDVQACRDEIAAWQQASMAAGTTTPEAQANLNSILENCKDAIAKSQSSI